MSRENDDEENLRFESFGMTSEEALDPEFDLDILTAASIGDLEHLIASDKLLEQ